ESRLVRWIYKREQMEQRRTCRRLPTVCTYSKSFSEGAKPSESQWRIVTDAHAAPERTPVLFAMFT
ncbi:unnamed protein product, partial [Musa acuminata subsp. burmannicoides]